MSIEEYIHKLQHVDNLIRIRGTGAPKEFARKIGVSERTLYRYIQELRDYGAVITYDEHRQSYVYEEEGSLLIQFVKKVGLMGVVVNILLNTFGSEAC